MATQTDATLNGWDLDAFRETVTTVETNPEAGIVTWRGRVSWDGHFGLDARTEAIEQLGQVIPTPRTRPRRACRSMRSRSRSRVQSTSTASCSSRRRTPGSTASASPSGSARTPMTRRSRRFARS